MQYSYTFLFQFVSRAFAKSQPNLRVNGRNFESLDENEQGQMISSPSFSYSALTIGHPVSDMEPFDEALDRWIWSHADNPLQWHSKIAETRRTQPNDIEDSFRDLLNQQQEVDVEEMTSVCPDVEGEGLEVDSKQVQCCLTAGQI
jgi:hypothetical protein